MPETLLHVILERRAQIMADIFARLLQYFRLSCENLLGILFRSIKPARVIDTFVLVRLINKILQLTIFKELMYTSVVRNPLVV